MLISWSGFDEHRQMQHIQFSKSVHILLKGTRLYTHSHSTTPWVTWWQILQRSKQTKCCAHNWYNSGRWNMKTLFGNKASDGSTMNCCWQYSRRERHWNTMSELHVPNKWCCHRKKTHHWRWRNNLKNGIRNPFLTLTCTGLSTLPWTLHGARRSWSKWCSGGTHSTGHSKWQGTSTGMASAGRSWRWIFFVTGKFRCQPDIHMTTLATFNRIFFSWSKQELDFITLWRIFSMQWHGWTGNSEGTYSLALREARWKVCNVKDQRTFTMVLFLDLDWRTRWLSYKQFRKFGNNLLHAGLASKTGHGMTIFGGNCGGATNWMGRTCSVGFWWLWLSPQFSLFTWCNFFDEFCSLMGVSHRSYVSHRPKTAAGCASWPVADGKGWKVKYYNLPKSMVQSPTEL